MQSRQDFVQSSEFEQLVLSIVDNVWTLNGLFDAHAEITEAFQQSDSEFTVKLSYFYQNSLHVLDNKISEGVFINNIHSEEADFLTSRIYSAKSQILHIIRNTINQCVLTPVMNQGMDYSLIWTCLEF